MLPEVGQGRKMRKRENEYVDCVEREGEYQVRRKDGRWMSKDDYGKKGKRKKERTVEKEVRFCIEQEHWKGERKEHRLPLHICTFLPK